jgi:hypothetical protein
VCVFAATHQRTIFVVVSECESRVFVVGAPWVVFDETWWHLFFAVRFLLFYSRRICIMYSIYMYIFSIKLVSLSFRIWMCIVCTFACASKQVRAIGLHRTSLLARLALGGSSNCQEAPSKQTRTVVELRHLLCSWLHLVGVQESEFSLVWIGNGWLSVSNEWRVQSSYFHTRLHYESYKLASSSCIRVRGLLRDMVKARCELSTTIVPDPWY